jgi:hypothetical protein
MNDQAASSVVIPFRATNFAAAARWAALGAFGFAALYFRYRALTGLIGGVVSLFAVQAVLSFLAGVRVDANAISLPRPLFKPIPLLVFGRTRIVLPLLVDITATRQFLGLEVVLLRTAEGEFPALFGSRAKRLAFFDAITSRKPDVKIYRQL